MLAKLGALSLPILALLLVAGTIYGSWPRKKPKAPKAGTGGLPTDRPR